MRLESFKKWEQFTGSYKKSVNPINLVEIPESSERRFYHLLQKLVDCKQITSSLADKAESSGNSNVTLFEKIKQSLGIMILIRIFLMSFTLNV